MCSKLLVIPNSFCFFYSQFLKLLYVPRIVLLLVLQELFIRVFTSMVAIADKQFLCVKLTTADVSGAFNERPHLAG